MAGPVAAGVRPWLVLAAVQVLTGTSAADTGLQEVLTGLAAGGALLPAVACHCMAYHFF